MNRHNTRVICLAIVLVVAATLLLAGCINAVRYTGMRETTLDHTTPELHFPETEMGATLVFVAAPSDYATNPLIPQTIYTLASSAVCDAVIGAFSSFVMAEDTPDEEAMSLHHETALQFSFKRKIDGKTETVLFYLSENGVMRQILLDATGNVIEDFYALVTADTLTWDLFSDAFQGRILAMEQNERPTSQAEMQTKFNALNRVSEENGIKTITILPDDLLTAWWSSYDATTPSVLSAEEVLFLINDSIRIYDEYDKIILPGFEALPTGNLSLNHPAAFDGEVISPIEDRNAGTEREDPRRTNDIFSLIVYRVMALSNDESRVKSAALFDYNIPIPAPLLSRLAGTEADWGKELWTDLVAWQGWQFYVPFSDAVCNTHYYQRIADGNMPDFDGTDPDSLEFFRVCPQAETVQIHYGNGTEERVVYPLFPISKQEPRPIETEAPETDPLETEVTETEKPETEKPETGDPSGCKKHKFDEWIVQELADCQNDGWKKRTCRTCGFTETAVIVSDGSCLYSEGKAPTCTEVGYEDNCVCSGCGAVSRYRQYTIDPLGHAYDENWTCTRCHKHMPYSEGLTFALSEDGKSYTLTGIGSCLDTHIRIPETVNGLPVTAIGYRALGTGHDHITAVTLPGALTRIETGAMRLVNLRTLVLPEGLTYIGPNAFYGTRNLESIVIPDSVTELGESAFCTSGIRSVTFGKGITSIPSNCFYEATRLEDVHFSPSITAIGAYAFARCSSIQTLSFPSRLTIIGDSAFTRCSSLQTLTLPPQLTTIEFSAFSYCSSLKTLTIPKAVTSLGKYAFRYCTNLETIIVEGKLISLSQAVFANAKKLKTVVLPSTLKEIGVGAFFECTALETITIPNGVTDIQKNAFKSCTALTTISLPQTLTQIGESAFEGCTALTAPVFPTSLTAIENAAFLNCVGFKTIVLAEGIEKIGNNAFKGCTAMTAIALPSTLVEIGQNAFASCTSLSSVTIPQKVKENGTFGLRDTALSAFSVDISNPYYTVIDGALLSKDGSVLYAYPPKATAETYTVPSTVKTIYPGAFAYSSALKVIHLPEGLTDILSQTFYECNNLEEISLPTTVSTIEGGAFAYCSKLKSIVIPEGVTVLKSETFMGCGSLESVLLPSTLQSIEAFCFFNCQALKSIDIPSGLRFIDLSAFLTSSVNTIALPASLESLTATRVTIHVIQYAGTLAQWSELERFVIKPFYGVRVNCSDGSTWLDAN